jgi:hypothetical protein
MNSRRLNSLLRRIQQFHLSFAARSRAFKAFGRLGRTGSALKFDSLERRSRFISERGSCDRAEWRVDQISEFVSVPFPGVPDEVIVPFDMQLKG